MKRPCDASYNDDCVAKTKKPRSFDFSLHPKRKIAFMFYYYGWMHDGLVQQANTSNTVEHHLMNALLKTKLIESWESCEFSRCGRTDKGVSAFRQVAACVVRSSDPNASGSFWTEGTSEEVKSGYKSQDELPFLKMLNGCLPHSIRVMCWAAVDTSFNARHQCTRRAYKYSMPQASLNLEAMKQACKLLVGQHDFRNFCQVDMNEARVNMSYVREIFDVTLDPVTGSDASFSLLELTVVGSGFLWHMIRYIVTVLHEIGCGNEKPELVTRLLDVEATPRRPQYTLAAETPLCLFDCTYDTSNLEWSYDDFVTQKNLSNLQRQWAELQTKCRLLEGMMQAVSGQFSNTPCAQMDRGMLEFTQAHPWPQKYTPFMERPTCESLEEKRAKLEKKTANSSSPS